MSKVNGIVKHAVGATYTVNSPAKFSNGAGKGGSVKAGGAQTQATGPVYTVNKPAVGAVKPSTSPMSTKAKSTGKGESPYAASYAKNASDVGSSGGQPSGCLKSSYSK